jgi:3-oxoacyl-[acyl-carrier-protein] synthase II
VTTTTTVAPLVITGCGVVSPAGHGLASLARTADTGAPDAGREATAPESIGGDLPPIPLTATPDLRVEEYLGKKGVRSLDRTTRLALVAGARALAELATPLADDDRARTGVVIGSSTGSVRSSFEFSRETLVRDKPYLVRASMFPSAVMNYCASQIAIWNSLRGVNATIADGRVSGLTAVRYARNAITQGHLDRALVGATEELCAQSAWAWHHSGVLSPDTVVGEGAAVFFVETPGGAAAAGRAPMAELLACEVGTSGVTGMRRGLVRCIERALRRSGVPAEEIDTISLGATGIRGLRAAEEAAIRTALGALPPYRLRTARLTGESYSATGALQIAGLLAAWRYTTTSVGRVALVTSIGDDGYAGCLVMRRAG